MKHDSNRMEPARGGLDCADARVQASAWLDGEWPSSDALASHLLACDDCRAHVEDLRALSARLAPLRFETPEPDLWPALAQRAIAARSRRAPPWRTIAQRAAAALVGCAGTAALLQATEGGPANDAASPDPRPKWPTALHGGSEGAEAIRTTLEQHLLAALERTTGERR
jgi:hypothetical protein